MGGAPGPVACCMLRLKKQINKNDILACLKKATWYTHCTCNSQTVAFEQTNGNGSCTHCWYLDHESKT